MSLEFKTTSMQASYHVGDASGYQFDITAHLDSEFGWAASVTVNTFGRATADSAVEHLIPSLESLVRMLKERSGKDGIKLP